MECEAVRVEGGYLRIRCADGSSSHVDAKMWEKIHGPIVEGQKIRRIVEKKENTFGTRYYGFVPLDFQIPDDHEDDTEQRKSTVLDAQ